MQITRCSRATVSGLVSRVVDSLNYLNMVFLTTYSVGLDRLSFVLGFFTLISSRRVNKE